MKFGAHVSIRGALHLAVDRAVAIGCECLQIFVGSPRQWRGTIFSQTGLDPFLEKRRAARLDPPGPPPSELINPAAAPMHLSPPATGAPTYSARAVGPVKGFSRT